MTGKKKLKMPNHFSTKGTSMIVCLPDSLCPEVAPFHHGARLQVIGSQLINIVSIPTIMSFKSDKIMSNVNIGIYLLKK